MRLLLLLSALLAALTGGGAAARPLEAAAVSATALSIAPERVRAHAHVLLATRPASVAIAGPAVLLGPAPRPVRARYWTWRRRE